MRQKIKKGKLEACKLVWKKRITAEKGISDKCAERIVQECIKLIEHMLYGNAMIAFHKQIHPATRTCHDCFPQARRNFLPGTRNAGRI